MELPESTLRLRELWRYMSTRAFVAGRAELMAQGFGPSQIQSWLRSGRLVPAVIERRYPMPLVNEKVFGKEVDNYWPDQKFALELDGGAFHSDPVQRRIDYEKQRYLESRGIAVVRLTYGQFDANPYGEVDRVAGMLGFI